MRERDSHRDVSVLLAMRVGEALNGYTQKYTQGAQVYAIVGMNLTEINQPAPRSVGLSLIRIYADRQENDSAAHGAPDLLLLAMKLGTSARVLGTRCVLAGDNETGLKHASRPTERILPTMDGA